MVDKEIPQLDVAGSIPVARSNQDEGVTGPPRSPSPSRLQVTQSVSNAAVNASSLADSQPVSSRVQPGTGPARVSGRRRD